MAFGKTGSQTLLPSYAPLVGSGHAGVRNESVHTLDTNAIVYYLKGDPVAATLRDIFQTHEPIYVSTISELELLSLPSLSTEEEALINFE